MQLTRFDCITNSAMDNIEKKLYTGLVFLDLTKAFDTVNHSILLYKLEHYAIRGIVNNFFGSFLTNRISMLQLIILILP